METIENEYNSEKPKKHIIKMVLEGLKGIKGTTEFATAITELVHFFGL